MGNLSDRAGRWLRGARLGQAMAARLGAAYMRLVAATTRWQINGRDAYDAALRHPGGVIACAWHGRLFMSPFWTAPPRPAVAVISQARDGDLIAALVSRFNVVAVRGSTYDREKRRDKGGAEAFAGALSALVDDHSLIAITPDGPRGPRMHAARGVATLSIQSGAPVQPIAFSVRRGIVLRNWDRFLVPWPFGRGVQFFGETLWPPADETPEAIEAHRARIEAELNRITQEADSACGRDPVLPASS